MVSAAQGRCCPALVAAGWEALCSATLVIPTMAVKRGKREGNALNPLKGMNVAGNSLEMNLSDSLKCNTLASGKFSQLLERRGWFWLLSSTHPCTGRGLLSSGACTLAVIVAASSVLILEITGGTGTDVLILSKVCTICSGQGNSAHTTTARECLKTWCLGAHRLLHHGIGRNINEKPPSYFTMEYHTLLSFHVTAVLLINSFPPASSTTYTKVLEVTKL